MEKAVLTSSSWRTAVAGLALSATTVAVLAGAESAYAQAKPQKTLYERLGGVFAIAAVIDHFSDAVVKNPIVGQKSKNPRLREWHTKNLGRLPGLKFMRTLWVCNISGGPFQYTATKPGGTPLGLEEVTATIVPQTTLRSNETGSSWWKRPTLGACRPADLRSFRVGWLPSQSSRRMLEAGRRVS